jgi:hypothetical protein
VPWPNSVEPDSTRSSPSRVSVTAARLFRYTSPLPVNPAPWWTSAIPIPRQLGRLAAWFQREHARERRE